MGAGWASAGWSRWASAAPPVKWVSPSARLCPDASTGSGSAGMPGQRDTQADRQERDFQINKWLASRLPVPSPPPPQEPRPEQVLPFLSCGERQAAWWPRAWPSPKGPVRQDVPTEAFRS